MTLLETRPRMLTGGIVLAIGGLLVAWLPTQAQDREPIEVKVLKDRPEKPATPAEEKAKGEQIEQARQQVRDLQEQADKMRAELRRKDEELRQAQERLADLEGRRPADARIVITIREPDGTVRNIPIPSGLDVLRRFDIPVPEIHRREMGIRRSAPPEVERRLEDLERKLDEVLKELEALRKEKARP